GDVTILARPGFLPPLTEPARGLAVADVSSTSTEKARLTELYATHGAKIHRFLSDLLGDAALAADATQETFVRAYKRLADIDEAGRPMPWLFGIARNVSLELRKARQRTGKHLLLVSGGVLEDAPARSSPESEYLDREALRVVGTAMARLPEERR